jgi:glycogen operon protein
MPNTNTPASRCANRPTTCGTVYIPGLKPGTLYGYRVDGPYDPNIGLRFNKNKLLYDPYAKAISGRIDWSEAMFGYPVLSDDPNRDLHFDEHDSAAGMPKSVVIDPAFDWGDDKRPNTPLHTSIIYEMHVKGFTASHPDIPRNCAARTRPLPCPKPSNTSKPWA